MRDNLKLNVTICNMFFPPIKNRNIFNYTCISAVQYTEKKILSRFLFISDKADARKGVKRADIWLLPKIILTRKVGLQFLFDFFNQFLLRNWKPAVFVLTKPYILTVILVLKHYSYIIYTHILFILFIYYALYTYTNVHMRMTRVPSKVEVFKKRLLCSVFQYSYEECLDVLLSLQQATSGSSASPAFLHLPLQVF